MVKVQNIMSISYKVTRIVDGNYFQTRNRAQEITAKFFLPLWGLMLLVTDSTNLLKFKLLTGNILLLPQRDKNMTRQQLRKG
jgi:hypothetical protein